MSELVKSPDVSDYLVPTAQKAAPSGNGSVPYIGFRGAKSQANIDGLDAAGIEVDEFYLFDGQQRKINPFQLHLLTWFSAFTLQDQDTYELTDASYSNPDKMLEEHIEGLALVVIPADGPSVFAPARFTFRKGHTAGLKAAISLLSPGGSAHNPRDMAAYGPDFKDGAQCKVVGGRFRIELTSVQKTPQNGGKKYNLSKGRIIPTPAADVAALEEYVNTTGRERLMAVGSAWNKRVDDIKALIRAQDQQ